MDFSIADQTFLQRAGWLATQGSAAVYPNPRVGAVLVHHQQIIGEGFHARSGGPHAEVVAIAQATAAGYTACFPAATLYVSLEPCCAHPGKRTPPCSSLIVETGIRRVVVGTTDPNPGVAGQGIAQLREAGIEVVLAPDPTPFQHLNRIFEVNQRQQRPYVVLKWAQSADGFLGGLHPDGSPAPVAISGPQAQRQVHHLRAWHHAIVVGRGTYLSDHPALTTRLAPGISPVPLVLTRQAHWQPTAPMQAWHIPENQAIASALHQLWQEKRLASLLIEGGKAVLESFLAANIADEIHLWQHPTLRIGAGTAAPVPPPGMRIHWHQA